MATLAHVPISDEAMDELAALARLRGVSVESMAGELLKRQLDRRARIADARRRFKAIAAMTPRGVAQSDRIEREERGQ